jgi:hypothetical protein
VTCPKCGADGSRVTKTLTGLCVTRARLCACGTAWRSVETVDPASIYQRPPVATDGHRRPPVATNSQLAIVSSDSDLPLIRKSDPSQASSKPQSQTRKRVEYPKAFAIEWELTAKTGSKDFALREWIKNGRDAFGLSWKAWEKSPQWMESWFNYPHVYKWLKDGRWKQDPTEAKVKPAAPTVAVTHVKPWIAAERAEEAQRSQRRFDAATARDQVQQELARERERIKAGGSQ